MKDAVKGGISNFRRRIQEVLLFTFITLLALSFFISRNIISSASLFHLNIQGLLPLLVCILVVWLLDTVKFVFIAQLSNVRITKKKSFEIVLASIFASNITPYYSGAMASQIYFLAKFGQSIRVSTAISSVYLILSLIVSVIFCMIFIFSPHSFISGVRGNFYFGLVVFVFLFSFFALFSMFYPEKLKVVINKVMKLFGREPLQEEKAMKVIDEFSLGLRYFLSQNKFLLLLVIVVSFFAQFFSILLVPLSFAALGLNFNFYEVFLTQVAMQFTASVGITPGGIGIIESIFAAFFYPLAHNFTASLTLLYRIASFYLPTLVGAFFFFKLLSEPKIRN